VWPEIDHSTEAGLLAALSSRRWSVSWRSNGQKSIERQFAEEFAAYNGAQHCVGVDHGSSALLIALESLDIGPGDEVIVPVLTWVAPITAVLRVGAVPVMIDVDPDSGCLTGAAIRQALTARTKAVIVVHLACTVADLDEIASATAASGVALIEDCSQAHGAQWDNCRVGTVGDLGVFSLGAAKTLAGGEGGAVITNDAGLYHRLQMLRADSRRYGEDSPVAGQPELVEDGAVMGANYCMSELSAAVLRDQLTRLENQNIRRQANAAALEQILSETDVVRPVAVPERVTMRAIYEYGLHVRSDLLARRSIDDFALAVSAELDVPVYPPRVPLHRSVLLRPATKRRYRELWGQVRARGGLAECYPHADIYARSTMLLHHSVLLGSHDDIVDVAHAVTKVSVAFGA